MAMQSSIFYFLAMSLTILCIPRVYGQLNAPCTASVLTSFNPCMSFLTSGSNITQPPPECCDALRSLMSNGTNCMCQIVTGTVPFRIPINRTMAVSLPRACNMPGGATLQCKTSSDAAPAPGPATDGSAMTPESAPTLSPQVDPLSPTSTPNTASTPAEAPTAIENAERRPSDNPAASYAASEKVSLLLLAMLGAIVLGCY